jgi:Pterin-4a-carbinolamine dehydratase
MILTEIASNAATAIIMTPITLSLAASFEFDPKPFIFAVCYAASASFITPVGYHNKFDGVWSWRIYIFLLHYSWVTFRNNSLDYFSYYDSYDLTILPSQRNKINKTISTTYEFNSYLDGIYFVNEIANLPEQKNHHPDIIIGYCEVTVSLTTHDAGEITEKDYRL